MISVLPKPKTSFDDSISSVSTISDEPAPIRILTRYFELKFNFLGQSFIQFIKIYFPEISDVNFEKTKIIENLTSR